MGVLYPFGIDTFDRTSHTCARMAPAASHSCRHPTNATPTRRRPMHSPEAIREPPSRPWRNRTGLPSVSAGRTAWVASAMLLSGGPQAEGYYPPPFSPPLAILSHKAGPAVRQHGCGCVMPLSCKPGTSRHSRGAVYATRAGHRPCVQWALPEKRGSLMARHSTCHMAPRCVPVSVHLRLRGLTPLAAHQRRAS